MAFIASFIIDASNSLFVLKLMERIQDIHANPGILQALLLAKNGATQD